MYAMYVCTFVVYMYECMYIYMHIVFMSTCMYYDCRAIYDMKAWRIHPRVTSIPKFSMIAKIPPILDKSP